MGGPNLEVFKFGLYLFVPIAALVHFGDPKWYHDHVLPYKDKLFPSESRTIRQMPTDRAAIVEELERFKAERRLRKAQREGEPFPDAPKRLV